MQHHKKTFSIFTTAKKNRFLALIFASLMVIVQPSFVYAELSPASYPMQAIRFYSIKDASLVLARVVQVLVLLLLEMTILKRFYDSSLVRVYPSSKQRQLQEI